MTRFWCVMVIDMNSSDKVLEHICIFIDGGTFNFIKALMNRIQIHTISFYPRCNINTVMSESRGEKEGWVGPDPPSPL